jgi:peptidoglycan glycosyltransferase
MFAFFTRRPGLGLFLAVLMFAGGGVLARQARVTRRSAAPPALSVARAKPRLMDWRDRLDLNRATLRGGRLVQTLRDGTKVTFSLDPDLQQWATTYLRQNELPYAAMVMYELEGSRLLVMAGHSSRDGKMGSQELCLAPWAPAASVFKLVTASALLDTGVPADTKICYHGGLRGLRKHHIVDNPRLDRTCHTLAFAVAKSVNPIMGKLAVRYLDRRKLRRWSKRFGFNAPVPFELGVQPSKAEVPKGDLELARVAAGFWHTEISVLHGAVLGGVAASGGLLKWPGIVERVRRANGRTEIPDRPEPKRVMSRTAAKELAEMMVRTTTMGTGRRGFFSRRGRPFLPEIEVGGKTGSLSRSKPYLHYNWFVGFAPAKKPRVAFAVLLGNPARWRIKAHTAARMLLDQYLKSRKGTGPVADRRIARR